VSRFVRREPGSAPPPRLHLVLDPFRASLCLLTIITISRVHQHFPLLARLRPALLLFGVAAVYALLNPRVTGVHNLLRTWPAKVVVALGVWACISAPFGISLGASGRFILEDFASVWLYAMALFLAIRCARELYTFIWAFVASTAVLVWLSLFVFGVSISHGGGVDVARLGTLYSYDGNDLGCMLLVGLALTLLVFQASRGKTRLASGVLLVGIGVALARTGSRGAFLGFIGAAGMLLWSLKGVSVLKRAGFVALVMGALIVAAPSGYWQQMGTVLEPTDDYNWSVYYGRKQLFARGVGYMLEYPIFGLGINNFGRAEGTMTERAKEAWRLGPGERVRWAPPHNSFIQAGAELGFPGLVLWSSLMIGGIVGMIRLRRRLPPAWLLGDPEERLLYLATLYLPVALAGFAIGAFFLSLAYYDVVYLLAALVSGVYVSVDDKVRRLRASVVVEPSDNPAGSQSLADAHWRRSTQGRRP